jgi:hypothetical protein
MTSLTCAEFAGDVMLTLGALQSKTVRPRVATGAE